VDWSSWDQGQYHRGLVLFLPLFYSLFSLLPLADLVIFLPS
jgi:hypothetical protein